MSFQTPLRAHTIALAAALALAACDRPNVPAENSGSGIDAMIAEAAAGTAAVNKTVAEIEKRAAGIAETPAARPKPPQKEPAVRQPILVDWKGPVEPLAMRLAERAGFSFQLAGKRPANPLQTAVSGEFGTPLEAIDSLSDAISGHAWITSDESRNIITIEYR